jgi:hypothetical protein
MRGEARLVAAVVGLALLTLLVPSGPLKIVLLTVLAAGFVLAVLVRSTE